MGKEADTQKRSEFEKLYADYRNRIYAYCIRRSTAADAADALSETFLTAWRRFDDIPDEPKTLAYLYGIAGRVISNQRRATGRGKRLRRKLEGLGVTLPKGPATLVLLNSEQAAFRAALQKLTPKDQELIMLDIWEELPRVQIAEIMSMSRQAVNQRLHRAYKRLGRSLEPISEPAPFSPPIAKEGGGA